MKTFSLFAILFISEILYSQKAIKLTASDNYPGTSYNWDIGAIGDKYYFANLSEDNTILLKVYDESMKLAEKKLSITKPEGKFESLSFITLANKIYYFRLISEKKKYTLYAWIIDADELSVSKTPVTIFSLDAESAVPINIHYNRKKAGFFIVVTPFNFKSNSYVSEYELDLFLNADLSVKWQKQIPYESPQKFNVQNFYVGSNVAASSNLTMDADGNIYIGYSEVQSNAKLKLNPEKYFVDVIDYEGTKVSSIELPFQSDVWINNLSLKLVDDKLVCAGFYGIENNSQPGGIYKIVYNKDKGNKISESFIPFTESYLALLDNSGINSNNGGLKDFMNVNSYVCENGDAIYYAQQRTTSITGNIIALYMNAAGDLVYNKVIRLTQMILLGSAPELVSDNANGYMTTVSDNAIYFLFNDNEKNAANSESESSAPFAGKNTAAFIVKIDENGQMDKKQINEPGDDYFLKLSTLMNGKNALVVKLVKGKSKIENFKYLRIE